MYRGVFWTIISRSIEGIVNNASEKLNVELEDGVGKLISQYTIEGRKAVNILLMHMDIRYLIQVGMKQVIK